MELKLAENAYLFDPPIQYEVDYFLIGNTSDFNESIAIVTLENGMEIEYSLTNPFPPFKGSPHEIIEQRLEFDFAHAFGHCEEDPNYTYLHWAICGWFKDRYQGEVNQEENYEL